MNDNGIKSLNNRYDNTSISLLQQTGVELYKEAKWLGSAETSMTDKNTTLDSEDNRSDKAILPVVQGEPVVVKLYNPNNSIRAMYITLDKANAVESQPSEINAWNSYKYEGLDEVIDGTTGELTIQAPTAINDIISFRVYAVNIDGTLVDPDGKAFYVSVGNPGADWGTVNTTLIADKESANMASAKEDAELSKLEGVAGLEWTADLCDNKLHSVKAFNIELLDKDGKLVYSTATESGNKKFESAVSVNVKPACSAWSDYIDDKLYKGTLQITNATHHILATLNVTMTKTLPTAFPTEFVAKTNAIDANGILTVYPEPKNSKTGEFDLDKAFNGLVNDIEFNFVDEEFAAASFDNGSDLLSKHAIVAINPVIMDNGESYPAYVTYTYGNISYDGKTVKEHKVKWDTEFAVSFKCMILVSQFSWAKEPIVYYNEDNTISATGSDVIKVIDAYNNSMNPFATAIGTQQE